jgi:hypothetical protein
MSSTSNQSEEIEEFLKLNQEFTEKVNKYYEYKSIYEEGIRDKKRKIKKKSKENNLSKKETLVEMQKYVPNCISCKRAVGTDFDKKRVDGVYHLTAKCGDNNSPCKLNFDINQGDVIDIEKDKREDEEKMNQYVQKIIIVKNDELFGFITEDEALERFIKINEEFDDIADSYRHSITNYLDIKNNAENKQEIKDLSDKFSSLVANMRKNIKDYYSTNNNQLITETVESYVNDVIPLVDNINNLKYKAMNMEYNRETGVHTLFQKTILVNSYQFPGGFEIISWEMGKQVTNNKTSVRNSNKSYTESEAQFNEGPIADNIVNMSMRDAESDDEVEEKKETEEVETAEKNSEQPNIIKLEEDENEENEENEGDDESVLSDASSVESEDKPPIKIGVAIDSSSDSFIPPPPPIDDEETDNDE